MLQTLNILYHYHVPEYPIERYRMFESEFYGDRVRWFVARVVNWIDPDKRGRVQIAIRGIHSEFATDIPTHALPWASTVLPTTNGGTSGHGKISRLLPNALVFGFFLDGKDSQLPVVIGHLNQTETPTSTQRGYQEYNSTAPYAPDKIQDPQAAGVIAGNVTYGAAEVPTSVSKLTPQIGPGKIDEKRLAAMKFFVANGYGVKQSAGIVGNLEAESNFNTTVVASFSGESSQGIAQWNPAVGRLQGLKQFGKNYNGDWRRFDTQLQYIHHELQGNNVNNDLGGSQSSVYVKLKGTTNYNSGLTNNKNATWIFLRYYENPADPVNKLAQRENYADKAYKQFTDSLSVG